MSDHCDAADLATALPLAGIRIIAVEQFGAGPYGTLYLSDMGAEVIKIEAPGTGDSARSAGPHFLGENESLFFQPFNLGKRSIRLDIKAADGRAVFERLVTSADAVLNNLRGDQPAKLRLTYADLSHLKPSIVCAHLSGYGREGERAMWPAYDYLLQAEAGFMNLTGEPCGVPTRMGLSIVDYLTGITTAFALTAALLGAAKTGRGRDVDVTLYDVAMHQLTYPAAWYLNEGYHTIRRPRSGHPSAVPCELFPTSDGHIFIMCILPKFWVQLCTQISRRDLVNDQRFALPADRLANRDALAAELDAILATRPTAHWMSQFHGKVPAAPVLTLGQALDNPHFRQSGGIQTVDHPLRPGLEVLASPIRLDGRRPETRPAPMLGADTDALLAELGYGQEVISDFRARRVI